MEQRSTTPKSNEIVSETALIKCIAVIVNSRDPTSGSSEFGESLSLKLVTPRLGSVHSSTISRSGPQEDTQVTVDVLGGTNSVLLERWVLRYTETAPISCTSNGRYRRRVAVNPSARVMLRNLACRIRLLPLGRHPIISPLVRVSTGVPSSELIWDTSPSQFALDPLVGPTGRLVISCFYRCNIPISLSTPSDICGRARIQVIDNYTGCSPPTPSSCRTIPAVCSTSLTTIRRCHASTSAASTHSSVPSHLSGSPLENLGRLTPPYRGNSVTLGALDDSPFRFRSNTPIISNLSCGASSPLLLKRSNSFSSFATQEHVSNDGALGIFIQSLDHPPQLSMTNAVLLDTSQLLECFQSNYLK